MEVRAEFPIGMMARLLGAGRSGYYDWARRGRGDPWAGARDAVMACWESSRGRFGARTVRARLAAQGTPLTPYRVRKIMRDLGIRGVVWNARKVTTVPDPGAPSRPDRGSQHASRLMVGWAAFHDVRLSVSRTGSCHDNAVAESFFATLKNETRSLRSWAMRAEARHAVVGLIEGRCNLQRPRPAIGYQIPAERMEAFMERVETALAGDGGEVPLTT